MTNKEWTKLTPYQHVRIRTEMYFGSRDSHTHTVLTYGENGTEPTTETWTPAGFTAVREIIDNAIDEVVSHGHGDRIDISYDPASMVFSVSDNGRGIPINWDETEQNYAATVLLSHTLTGRNFVAERGETRGVNGIGGKGVNFCSEFLDIEIERDGKRFEQRFREGDNELVVDAPFIFPSDNRTTGTRIRFRLSERVFPILLIPEAFFTARVREIALCYPNVKVFFNGQRIVAKRDPAALFPNHKPIAFSIQKQGFDSTFWLVPSFMPDGREHAFGLVNAIPVFNGGTHIDAFKRGFFSGLLAALERQSKKRGLEPNRSDVADGLLIYNITHMAAPTFDSQSKTRMINEEVATIIRKEMDAPEFFRKVIKNNPDWIEEIYERCAQRSTKKDEAEVVKAAKKNKRQKIEDLEDACGVDRAKCILFLAEGKSAISGMVEARNPEIHGGLPLRGKVKNVRGESLREVMSNETLRKIMGAIGLVPAQRANRHTLRYGQIFLTTDADEDGKNIAALLVNFFFDLWPELFDPNKPAFISVFDTPLIIAAKGKQRKYWYNDDYAQFDPEKFKGWEITRAKGLAALKREDWRHVLANPKIFPIIDDGHLDDTLRLLFDQSDGAADTRKAWIGM